MLRYKTDRTWFSCLLWYLARKCCGPILTTPEPARCWRFIKEQTNKQEIHTITQNSASKITRVTEKQLQSTV